MTKISRSITAITPVILKAVMRDHCLVLEGRIDDDNLYYVDSSGAHIPLSPSRVTDLPTSKNGVYADKFFAEHATKSFFSEIWTPLMNHVNANHIYRQAVGGPVDISGLNRVKGSKDGAEEKNTAKTCKAIIKKPENWKLLYCYPKEPNGVLTGLNYTIQAHKTFMPCAALSFEMSKRIYEDADGNKTGIDNILSSVDDSPDQTVFDYTLIYNKVDVEDEYVYFQVSLNVAYEVIL